MAQRKSLSDTGVAALKARATRYAEPDPELRGHYVRVAPIGAKTFWAVARAPDGKQVWTKLGPADALPVEQSRAKARDVLTRVRAGLPAFEAPQVKPESFGAIAETYLKGHVEANGLRSRPEIARCIAKYVLPSWANREFVGIRRSDIATLLDRIQDDHGFRQAGYVLAIIRGIANWYATRHDDYVSPFTRGMRRTDPKTRKRTRILDDDEIRALWKVTDDAGRFGAIARLLLLTAQRRDKIASMRWSDVALDGTWNIPSDEREKGTAGALLLPPAALQLVQRQPRLGDNPYVFAGRGTGPFSGFSKAKSELNEELPAMPTWILHDLRRTARSLMARAGVRPDIAERVMGHVIGGVEGVYDQHEYRDEKADALRRLTELIQGIVEKTTGKNVAARRRAI
jgi:integrase